MGAHLMPRNQCYKLPRGFPSWLQKRSAIMLLLLIPNVLCGGSHSGMQSNENDELVNTDFDYCSIICDMGPHTLCTHQQSGPGANCRKYKYDKLSPSEKEAIVNKHNEFRNQIALGEVEGYPKSSNIMELSWDKELEMIAQRWADQCTEEHDDCRDNREGDYVGQNIAVTKISSKQGPAQEDVESLVKLWYNQINYYEYKQGWSDSTGYIAYFFQVVFAKTKLIGCGRSSYQDGRGLNTQYLVCNYAPGCAPGYRNRNYPLYDEGEPCTRCTCSDRWPGLCAVGSEVTDEN